MLRTLRAPAQQASVLGGAKPTNVPPAMQTQIRRRRQQRPRTAVQLTHPRPVSSPLRGNLTQHGMPLHRPQDLKPLMPGCCDTKNLLIRWLCEHQGVCNMWRIAWAVLDMGSHPARPGPDSDRQWVR